MTTVEGLLRNRAFFVRREHGKSIQVSFGPRSQLSPAAAWRELLQLQRMPQRSQQ